MKFPATRFRVYETRAAERDDGARDAGSACEISIVSDAPPRRFARGYKEEREETLALQEHRYRCRVDLVET